ncbi:MAG: tetratricopeptide repeat protein [Chromatiaceae bacterium]|nr:tetratricopeptide repeat protein [Chromatiaceae bacterium]MCP5445121.1 tetratricopeptide repeat protein [Chromatiaceae bacterium]
MIHFSSVMRLLVGLFALSFLLSCGGNKEDRKSKYFERGMELYEQGNYLKARLEFKNVLQIDPNDAEGYYMFGQIEEHEQDWRKAYALFTRVIELNPSHSGALVHLGRLYALSGEPGKALESAATVLKNDPDNIGALVLKGLANARLGKKDVAIREAQSAVDIDPGNADAISLLSALYADRGDVDGAIGLARAGIEKQPKALSLYILLARLYEKNGNTEGVIEALGRMIELKPNELTGYLRLAAYHITKGNKAEGEKVLRQAITAISDSTEAKLALIQFLENEGADGQDVEQLKAFITDSPDVYELQIHLAKIYTKRKDNEGAKKIYRQIIDKAGNSPDTENARTLLAGLLVSEKNNDAAMVLIEEVLKENPKQKEALLLRAALSLDGKEPDKGIADLRTLLKDDPGYVKAHRLKARAHLLKHETALARQSLENAIQASPQEAAANIELVQLLVNTGELDDAVTVLGQMSRFAPDNLAINQTIAQIRAKQQQWDEVTKISEWMRDTAPNNPLGYYYQGMALQGANRLDESVQAFEQALKLNPDATEPLIDMSRSLLLMGKADQALERIEQVVNRNPKHFLAKNLQGEVLLGLKRYADAEAAFNAVLQINPNWDVPYKNLAKTYIVQGNITEAIDVIRNGFKITQDPLLGLELATHLDRSGERELAAGIYKVLLERFPNLTAAANNYAMLLTRGSPSQEDLNKAARLVQQFELSENAVYLDTLGWVTLKQGKLEKAIDILKKAVKGSEDNPEIRYHLGAAYYEAGHKEEARKELEISLASGVTFDGMERARQLLVQMDKG